MCQDFSHFSGFLHHFVIAISSIRFKGSFKSGLLGKKPTLKYCTALYGAGNT